MVLINEVVQKWNEKFEHNKMKVEGNVISFRMNIPDSLKRSDGVFELSSKTICINNLNSLEKFKRKCLSLIQ